MHRRARHLNARDAGAVLVLDSRFITGLSDGDAIETWSDRSRNGNNVTQGTIANRPTFKTSIQGGNPVVRFDGTSDFFINSTISLGTSYTITAIAKQSVSSIYQRIVHFSSSVDAVAFFGSQNGNFATFFGYISGWRDVNPNVPNQSILDAFRVLSVTNNGVTAFPFFSGIVQTAKNGATVSSTGLAIGNGVSTGNTQFFNGEISIIYITTSVLSNEMRRRLEHSAAFAFKIPCN
jgi:hypothetical protein